MCNLLTSVYLLLQNHLQTLDTKPFTKGDSMKSYTRWPRGSWMRLTSADTLRALMKQRNFSMERLGRYSGCSKSFIHHLCSGRKGTCTPQLAERIAEALEVPIEILFVLHASTGSGRTDDSRLINDCKKKPTAMPVAVGQ